MVRKVIKIVKSKEKDLNLGDKAKIEGDQIHHRTQAKEVMTEENPIINGTKSEKLAVQTLPDHL